MAILPLVESRTEGNLVQRQEPYLWVNKADEEDIFSNILVVEEIKKRFIYLFLFTNILK